MSQDIHEFDIIETAIARGYDPDDADSDGIAFKMAFPIVAGVAWLDAVDPRWWHDVSTDILHMESCTHCVLGQVVGDYAAAVVDSAQSAISRDQMPSAEARGFAITHRQAQAMGFEIPENCDNPAYRDLTAGWKALILHRQSERR